MSKLSAVYKFPVHQSELQRYEDNAFTDGGATYNNYSWYQKVIQGSSSRMQKYTEYDVMDADVEIARALDTIAEEISGNSKKDELPLHVVYLVEDDKSIPANTTTTLNAALRYWCEIHDLKNKTFNIARCMIKYGDCFFVKTGEFGRWKFVHPKQVLAALADPKNPFITLGFQIRNDNGAGGELSTGFGPQGQESAIELVTVEMSNIVRFTTNDDMSTMAPFGCSVLQSVYKAQKQKELLEEAIIIYRISRAPERRVFYIDVGKMPPQMTKKYLEQVKNEIKQRKIPNPNGAGTVDSVYNAPSMNEDFFFAQRPDGKSSKVETLPGGQNLGELTDLEYFQSKVFRGLRIPVSWMKEGSDGAQFNDGRLGQSYIAELRFTKYVERLQAPIEREFDVEFKRFLKANNIQIDESLFKIVLPEPTNFAKYREQELNAALLNSVGTALGVDCISKQTALSEFLQWSEEQIRSNEVNLRIEKNLPSDAPVWMLYGGVSNSETDFGVGLSGSTGGNTFGSSDPMNDNEVDTNTGDTTTTDTDDAKETSDKSKSATIGKNAGAL